MELNDDDLPEGTSHSGIIALMDDYPVDEMSSKKIQKNKTGKGIKCSNKSKKCE